MKRTLIATITAAALGGCAGVANSPVRGYVWTNTTTPVAATSNERQEADRKGEACATSVLWVAAWGDASIETAARNGGITTITSVEASQMGTFINPVIPLPFFEQYCTIVRGRSAPTPAATRDAAP